MIPQARHPDVQVGIDSRKVSVLEWSPGGDRDPSSGWV